MRAFALAASAVLVLSAGCRQAADAPPQATTPVTQPAPERPVGAIPAEKVEQKPAVRGTARSLDIAEVRLAMKHLGIAYLNYELTNDRAPKNRAELAPFYEDNGKINRLLEKNAIVFLYGARAPADAILAYEEVPDQAGIRVVVLGNGEVRDMDEATFQKAPRAGNVPSGNVPSGNVP